MCAALRKFNKKARLNSLPYKKQSHDNSILEGLAVQGTIGGKGKWFAVV